MAAYQHLPYNILSKSKRDGCPAMPAGHIHLSKDRVALPAHRKRHTCVVPGSGLRGPPLLGEGPTANIYPPEQRHTACCAQLFPD